MDAVPRGYSDSRYVNVAGILHTSRIYGPGERMAIWVQGCSLHCPGCWNEEMWPFEERNLYTTDLLLSEISSINSLEGITILGGEPLHQAAALLEVVTQVRATGLSVMLYTGFEEEEITDPSALSLIRSSDIVVFGRYREDLRSDFLKWRGSENQKIIFPTSRYEAMKNEIDKPSNEMEIHITDDGMITLVGYPENEMKVLIHEVL